MTLAAEWLSDIADFGALAAQWEALQPRDATPFDTHRWYEAWWRSFGGEDGLAVCAVRRDGELAGALPLMEAGNRLRGLANSHSGMFRPLARDPEAMEALIAAAFGGRAAAVELSLLPLDDPTLPLLQAGAREAGRFALTQPGSVSPIVETDGDVEAWRKGAKSSWKSRLARYRRKMVRDYDAELEILTAPEDLDARLQEGFRIEAGGWKGESGTAILSNADTTAFYRDIAHRFHERGELRLSRIVLDGEPVAFSFCLFDGCRLYSLKTGYDERFRKLVPGLVLQVSIIERCFELGLDAYELLGETTDWKEKLAGSSRRYANLRAYPHSPAGALRYGYRGRLRPLLRNTYRRVRPRRR